MWRSPLIRPRATDEDLWHCLTARLQSEGQTQLLRFRHELSSAQRRRLAEQITALDISLVNRLYRQQTSENARTRLSAELACRARPLSEVQRAGDAAEAAARHTGRRVWRARRAGVILVAGGDGSRQGFHQPKGMYPIGPLSGASLFQLLIEKIVGASRRYGAPIPLYLITSPATHDATVEFLEAQRRFGLPREQLIVFPQAMLPALDQATGEILLAAKDRLALAPDGHGGLLRALLQHELLEDMRASRLDHLCYAHVDNPLAGICDAGFLGRHVRADADVTAQAVRKRMPQDRLGNLLCVDGRVRVVEYSEMPAALAEQRGRDGALRFWAGSIGVQVFRREFLQRAAELSLPFHAARKSVPCLDERGDPLSPRQPNAIKLEQFIFDALPLADRAAVVEVERSSHFAPLKNRSGSPEESPEAVRQQLLALHRRWLAQAGFALGPDALVEISPLLAQDAGQPRRRLRPGAVIPPDGYLR